MKVKWAKEAKLQLREILRFYAKRNQSKTYSTHLKRGLLELIAHFRKNPHFGEQLGENESIRRVSFGHFVIIYEIKSEAVEIFSVRDGRREEE